MSHLSRYKTNYTNKNGVTKKILTMVPFLALLTLPGVSSVHTAQSVCVYNDAAFVLHWNLRDIDHNTSSTETNSYPVWQVKCMSALEAGDKVTMGTSLIPAVKAIWGKSIIPTEKVLYDAVNATQVTYVCQGTTLDYHCIQTTPPPTAKNITKDVGEFLIGFTRGLGTEIGFTKCLADIDSTYQDIIAVVDFFESGINHKTLPAIIKAFELIGDMLKDFGAAITECVKDGAIMGAKIIKLSKILSGNVLSIIKIIIDDVVHIFHEKKEITDDCKSTVTHWRAGDYQGAGNAVGNIVGIILGGIE